MLKLTRKADYGLISLKHLAMNGCSSSAKEISDTYGLPLPLLSKVLQKLTRTGFLQSEHGTNGGYRLRRDPRGITALEVIRTIDGPVFLTSCFTGGEDCGAAHRCNVREPLRKVHDSIQQLLDNITIADMCEEEAPAASCPTEPASAEETEIYNIAPVVQGV